MFVSFAYSTFDVVSVQALEARQEEQKGCIFAV